MKSIQFVLTVLLLSLFFSCAPKQAQITKAKPDYSEWALPVDSLVHKGVLKNGLTYYIRHNAKPEKRVELRLVVKAGSVLETDDQQGLAHLCEHMAFNGSKHFHKQELVSFLESIGMRFGADLNAYTSFDETVYMLQIPTDDEDVLDKGFYVLEDWAAHVTYDDEEIDKERGVVIEEWRLGRGAGQRMLDKQLPVILKGSRYAHRLPIGQKAVLDTFKHETLRRFYKTWYHPALMAVVAVGDLDVDKMEALIRRHFEPLTNPSPMPVRKTYSVPGHKETLYAIATDPEATSTTLSMYNVYPLEKEITNGDYRKGIVKRLFAGILNQRYQELSQREDPPFIYAYAGAGQFVGPTETYTINTMARPGQLDRAAEAMLTEARRVAEFGFTKSELMRQKQSMLRSMQKAFLERDKNESRSYADEYKRNFLNDEPIPGIGYEYEMYKRFLPGITLEEVNQLAEKWIQPHNRVFVVSAPEKEGQPAPTKDELIAVQQKVARTRLTPYQDDALDQPLLSREPAAGKVVAEKTIDTLHVTEWTLQNGVKVVLKPTDFKNDEIRFTAFSPGGYSLVADEDLFAAKTASGIIGSSGFGPFNAMQLQKKLAGKMAHVGTFIGELSEGMSGSASPQDLETMFRLIYLEFTSPREDSSAYRSYLTKIKSYLENKDRSPEAAYQDSVTATFTQHHPRYRPLSLKTLNQLDMKKSFRVYRDRFADAGDFTFVFVGNFTKEQMRPLVETYLGGLPAQGRKEHWADKTFNYPKTKKVNIFHKGLEPKSLNNFIFPGIYHWSDETVAELNTFVGVLRIKLREYLRESKSGTYGVGVSVRANHFPRERYSINISFGCDPQRVEELTRAMFSQIDSIRQFGVDESYLQKVKNMSAREFETSLKKNNFWLSALKQVYWNGQDPASILKRNERIQALTMKDIIRTANTYLDPDVYVRVVLLPERGSK